VAAWRDGRGAARLILVVLPAYNEAEALPRLIDRLRAVRPQMTDTLCVLVADDGSSDDTATVAEHASTSELPVVVERRARNGGLHAALDTGLRAAVACSST